MAETLYNLAAVTNNDRWAKAGDRFQKKSFINPLALRRDELRGLHVNTHIPQVIARRPPLRDLRRHALPRRGRLLLLRSDAPRAPTSPAAPATPKAGSRRRARLAAELKRSANTAECCCAYNMLKLTRQLYTLESGSRATSTTTSARCSTTASAPSSRKSGLHAVLPLARRPAPGRRSTRKTRRSGAAPDRASRNTPSSTTASTGATPRACTSTCSSPPNSIGRRRASSCGRRRGIRRLQSTTLTVTAARPATLAMRLRIPGWLQTAPSVKLNGKALDASAAPGSYLDAEPDVEGRRQDRDGAADAPARRSHAGRSATCRRSSTDRWCWPAISAARGSPKRTSSDRICASERRMPSSTARRWDRANTTPPVPETRDSDVPGVGRGSELLDQAGRQAADLPDYRPEEGCDTGSAEQPVRPAVLGLLASRTAAVVTQRAAENLFLSGDHAPQKRNFTPNWNSRASVAVA